MEYLQPLKDVQSKVEHSKQRFAKAEKNFMWKRDKVIGVVGDINTQRLTKEHVDSMLPEEAKELE